jgi:hypothetical protein
MTDKEKIVLGVVGAGVIYIATRPKKVNVAPGTGAVAAAPQQTGLAGILASLGLGSGQTTGGSASQAASASGIIGSIGSLFSGIGSVVRGVDNSSPSGSTATSSTSGSGYGSGGLLGSGITDPGAVDLGDPTLSPTQGGFGGGSTISLSGSDQGSTPTSGASDPFGLGGLTLSSDLAN